MGDKYFGVYLIPPPEIAYAISVGHSILSRDFNARTAAAFMAHCTIKGFTRLLDETSPESLLPALDEVFERTRPFVTWIEPPWVSNGAQPGDSVLLWLTKSADFQALHDAVWHLIEPHVSPRCLFTPKEPHGHDFPPHITLVQSDLSPDPGIRAQAKAVCDYIYRTLPATQFQARDYQLIEFQSEDWAGAWWDTLRFRQIKGWSI